MNILQWIDGTETHTGADSSVTILPWSDFVIKRYHCLSVEDIRQYAQLHEILSADWYTVECSDKLRDHFWISLQRIELQFLCLGDDIFSEWWVCQHRIPYVSGDALYTGAQLQQYIKCTKSHINVLLEWMERTISELMAKKLGTTSIVDHDLTSPYVCRSNIKVVSFEDNVLRLAITDIGSSIKMLLEENRQAIDKILQAQS